MKLIAIDDGHGNQTPGKRTPVFPDGSQMLENEFNAPTASYLAEALKQQGFQTIFVAPEDADTPLATRVARANVAHADVYVSIHANAYGNDWNSANGVESWIYQNATEDTLRLGLAVQAALAAQTGLSNRGLKRSSDLYVLRQTDMPAVLVECGFMTNLAEAKLLKSQTFQKRCADAICQGLCVYFGVPYSAEEEVEDMKRYKNVDELPYGKQTIEKLLQAGALKGTAEDDLNLSEDMLRIFMVLDLMHVF